MNLYKNKTTYVNILIYLFLALIFRFIIPGIDEPDWILRIKKIITGHDDYSSFINKPINLFDFFSNNYQEFLLIYNNCNLVDSPLSLWFSFNYFNCVDNFKIILIKYFITLTFFLPLFLAIYFKNRLQKLFNFDQKKNNENIQLVSLCILFPSFIYTANFTSYETLCLFLALIIFIFKENKNLFFLISIIILFIDMGFCFILLMFYFFINTFLYLSKKFDLKLIILFSIIITLINIFLKNSISYLIEFLPIIGQKAFSINEYSQFSGHTEKYFILARPLTLFTGFVFLTAYKTKTIFLYPIFFIIFCNFFIKIKNKNFYNKLEVKLNSLYFIGSILFLTNISIIFPVLSFSKYYIFTLPFLIKIFLNFYSIFKIRNFLLISNIIVIFHFVLYYLV